MRSFPFFRMLVRRVCPIAVGRLESKQLAGGFQLVLGIISISSERSSITYSTTPSSLSSTSLGAQEREKREREVAVSSPYLFSPSSHFHLQRCALGQGYQYLTKARFTPAWLYMIHLVGEVKTYYLIWKKNPIPRFPLPLTNSLTQKVGVEILLKKEGFAIRFPCIRMYRVVGWV